MRKGAKRIDWSLSELRFLTENAGKLTIREICFELKRSRASVESQAKRLGLTLRCYKPHLEWCPVCATWRRPLNEKTGMCRVCAKRQMLKDSEERLTQALSELTTEQRAEYGRQEAHRATRRLPAKPHKSTLGNSNPYLDAKAEEEYLEALETWEIKCLDFRINASKKRLQRAREKSGTNPRKNF